MIKVQGLRRNVKNVVKNYSEVQIKVREATSNDPWGPSGTLMMEIADLSYNVVAFSEIMQVIWKRLNDHGKNWKHVYKALILLEYLLKCGSERIIQQCKENIFVIETLKDFRHVEDSKDQGISIREKAKVIVTLLKDEERLKSERARALRARERFSHSSSTERMGYDERQAGVHRERQPSFDHGNAQSDDILRSELERVRPQTVGEEELQLQLALAVSKEESDQAERLKRNDELRLQMAITESRDNYEKTIKKPVKKQSSAMEDLVDVFVGPESGKSVGSDNTDPWGMPVSHSVNSLASSASGDASLMPVDTGFSSFHMTNSASCYDFNDMKNSLSGSLDAANVQAENDSIHAQFLGDNSNLVNLDALVQSRSHGNPFQPPKPLQPSINELRAHNSNFSAATLPPKSAIPGPTLIAARADSATNDFHQLSNNPFI